MTPSNQLKAPWAICLAAWLALWALTFLDTLASAISVWRINDTFNHCFLILPGTLFLAWKERGAIAAQRPYRSFIGLAAVIGILGIYALGKAAYIEVLQHIAAFELLPALVIFLFGWRVAKSVWFPLLFISFAIPIGEEFFPLFQNITADIAIILLKVLQVPVYRDGLYISIPNGQFVVAEACSGIRFFIACVVLGAAFAYVNFISKKRAFCFALISILMPIVANGIRAFGIIYTGYVSDMRYAVGADHLIYGWFFFALIILLLVFIAHLMSDGHRQWHDKIDFVDPRWRGKFARNTAIFSIVPLCLSAALSLLQAQSLKPPFELESADLTATSASAAEALSWTPRYRHADLYRMKTVPSKGITLYQAIYQDNVEGKELISWQNRVFDVDRWSMRNTYTVNVKDVGTIEILDLTSNNGHSRLLAYWYVVPGYAGSNPYLAKIWQAVNSILLRPSGGALVAVGMEYRENVANAMKDLAENIKEDGQKISNIVD